VRKIREVLRPKAEGFSDRQIDAAISSARSTVQKCVRRARDAGVAWPLPPTMDEAALHAKMYRRVVPLSRTLRADFSYLHAELRSRGVTRLLLWMAGSTACSAISTAAGSLPKSSGCARNTRRATGS
jgi:hypothetical protein